MTDTGTTLCEACGTALLDDEPSCWRCGHHPGLGPVRRRLRPRGPDGFILLVLGGVASLVALFAFRIADQLPPDIMTDLPSCIEEEGVSERFTEIWRLSMDETPAVPVSESGGVAAIDPAEKVEGLASTRISVQVPARIWLGSFLLDTLLPGRPLDGGTLVVRARIRADGDFPTDVALGVSVSGADSFSVGPLDIPADEGRPWRLYELTYVGSPDHEGGRLDLWLLVPGPGTVWIDEVRILRGPPFEGTLWNRLLVTERVQRPAAGLETILATLTTEGRQDVSALIRDARDTSLYRAFEQRSPGAEPPDRVERCLTELYLAWKARERPSPLAVSWMNLTRGRRISPAILYWRETIHGFHQPDYLERLVRVSPSAGLVDTYGRDVVPPMLAHGAEILGVAVAEPPRDPVAGTELRATSQGFVEMTDLLLREAEAGRWELTREEREELRILLEARLPHVPEDPGSDPMRYPVENRELLESVLRRLGSEAAGPVPDPGTGRQPQAPEATTV